MNLHDLIARVAKGEDSSTQFKVDLRNNDALAAEMAAFANAEGGSILIGVADDGSMPGLSREDVSRINQMIGNAASQLVRSPLTVQTRNVLLEKGRVVILLTVPKGFDKPYFDKNGIGSGIKRALADWPAITFTDDRDGCLFRNDLRKTWGFKAATRAFHIANTGRDVNLNGPFKGNDPTTIPTDPVRGSPPKSRTLFDLSQVLSWLAKERNDLQEQVEWREQIPDLLAPLAGT